MSKLLSKLDTTGTGHTHCPAPLRGCRSQDAAAAPGAQTSEGFQARWHRARAPACLPQLLRHRCGETESSAGCRPWSGRRVLRRCTGSGLSSASKRSSLKRAKVTPQTPSRVRSSPLPTPGCRPQGLLGKFCSQAAGSSSLQLHAPRACCQPPVAGLGREGFEAQVPGPPEPWPTRAPRAWGLGAAFVRQPRENFYSSQNLRIVCNPAYELLSHVQEGGLGSMRGPHSCPQQSCHLLPFPFFLLLLPPPPPPPPGQAWSWEDTRNILFIRPKENTGLREFCTTGIAGGQGGHILTLKGECPST